MDGCKHSKVDQIVFKHTKTLFLFCFFVKGLKVLAKSCLNWIFGDLQDLSLRSDAQKHMVEYDFGHNFMTLNILKLEFFSYFLNTL